MSRNDVGPDFRRKLGAARGVVVGCGSATLAWLLIYGAFRLGKALAQ